MRLLRWLRTARASRRSPPVLTMRSLGRVAVTVAVERWPAHPRGRGGQPNSYLGGGGGGIRPDGPASGGNPRYACASALARTAVFKTVAFVGPHAPEPFEMAEGEGFAQTGPPQAGTPGTPARPRLHAQRFSRPSHSSVHTHRSLSKWRRGRDSNPRYACTHNGFQDRRIRPLCHPSA